jgi:hypothetical protein
MAEEALRGRTNQVPEFFALGLPAEFESRRVMDDDHPGQRARAARCLSTVGREDRLGRYRLITKESVRRFQLGIVECLRKACAGPLASRSASATTRLSNLTSPRSTSSSSEDADPTCLFATTAEDRGSTTQRDV